MARIAPDVKAAVLEAVRNPNGRSRAEVAREFGIGPASVSRLARDAGITPSWDTAPTREATVAARDHLRARRARLSERFLVEADKLLDKLHGEWHVYSFGGKDNTYNEKTLPGPPAADIRNIMTSAAVAFDKHLAADKHDAGDETDGMVSMLGRLAEGLGAAHERMTADPGDRGPTELDDPDDADAGDR